MSISKKLLALVLLTGATLQAQAGLIFTFTESGGNVLMQSSGVLDTSQLVSVSPSGPSGWSGTGIETNAAPDNDIMGDTSMGGVDTYFGFNTGTDVSPWIGNMFTQSVFSWSSTGTTQFATYYRDPNRTPGLGISAADLVGDLWTADVSWSRAGTFASLGMTVGDYTITDNLTNEFISIRIGQVSTVPEPSTLALLGLGLAGISFARKNKSA